MRLMCFLLVNFSLWAYAKAPEVHTEFTEDESSWFQGRDQIRVALVHLQFEFKNDDQSRRRYSISSGTGILLGYDFRNRVRVDWAFRDDSSGYMSNLSLGWKLYLGELGPWYPLVTKYTPIVSFTQVSYISPSLRTYDFKGVGVGMSFEQDYWGMTVLWYPSPHGEFYSIHLMLGFL